MNLGFHRAARAALGVSLLLVAGCDAVSVVGYVEGSSSALECPAGSPLLDCADSAECTVQIAAPNARLGGKAIAVGPDARLYYLVDDGAGNDAIEAMLPDQEPQTLATSITQVQSLVADADHVYWLARNDGMGRAPVDGSAPAEAIPLISFGNGRDMALGGGRVFASVVEENETSHDGSLNAFTIADGEQRQLTQARPLAVAATRDQVLWSNDGTPPGAGEIVSGPFGLSGAEVLTSGIEPPLAIAAEGAWVFWIDASGHLFRVAAAGGDAEELASGMEQPKDIVAFDGWVYVAAYDGLLRFASDGGEPKTLWEKPVLALGVGCSGVYALQWFEDGVVRFGRPL